VLDFFVGGETVMAGGTFAAAADGRAFSGGARVNDFVFLTSALGATHKTTAYCGSSFVTHKALWCQGFPKLGIASEADQDCVMSFFLLLYYPMVRA
jgi:hypothetical protein